MKIHKILTILGFLVINSVSAGVPVFEENSAIWQPMQWMEMMNTQLNTINQYEQLVMTYQNELKQLENMDFNSIIDRYKITDIHDLRNTLQRLQSDYAYAINKYNSFAERTNKLIDQGCDFLEKYDYCTKEQLDEINALNEEIKARNEEIKKSNDITDESSIAYKINKDQEKIKDFASNKNSKTKEGTNQVLADTREEVQLLNEQMVESRKVNHAILSTNQQTLSYIQARDAKEQQYNYKKNLENKDSWKTKKYKDHY